MTIRTTAGTAAPAIGLGPVDCLVDGEDSAFARLVRHHFPYPAGRWSARPAGVPHWSVTHAVRPDLVDQLLRDGGRRAAERLETFPDAWTSRFRAGPGTVAVPGGGRPDALWTISPGRVATLSRGPSGARSAVRAVRELYLRLHEGAGDLFLHGAAVGTPVATAVIAGPKGAGKTTLALAACRAGLSYVGNDRVRVHRDGEAYRAATFPMVLRVHPGTLLPFPRTCSHPGSTSSWTCSATSC